MIEIIIRSLAVAFGILTLVAPAWVLSRIPHGNPPGVVEPASGSSRTWHALASTAVLVLIGVTLWRPVPVTLSERLGLGLTLLGGLVYIPGIALYLWGLWTLGAMFRVSSVFGAGLPTFHTLIQRGPYRYIRHPMYLGVILAAVGALFIFRTWAMVLFFPASFVVVARARREETELARRHTAAWDSYAERVPGWIPRNH